MPTAAPESLTYNPAAIIGFAPTTVIVGHLSAKSGHLHASVLSSRASKYSGRVFTDNVVLMMQISQLPMFATQLAGAALNLDEVLKFEGVDYPQVLEMMGMLHQAGIFANDSLQYQQAEAQAKGVMPEFAVKAYDEFVRNANDYLAVMKALNLASVTPSTKGIRSTRIPVIAQALSKGKAGIHVSPDSRDPKAVVVAGYSLTKDESTLAWATAKEFYAPLGFRALWLYT